MPFLLYKRQVSGDSIRYERLQALKLGGVSGPIASFVGSLRGDAAKAGWEVPPLSLARPAGANRRQPRPLRELTYARNPRIPLTFASNALTHDREWAVLI